MLQDIEVPCNRLVDGWLMFFYPHDNRASFLDLSSFILPSIEPLAKSAYMNWSSSSKVIIQGITDDRAAFCAVQMKAYGTKIVAGISPGNGGTEIEGIPVFDLVEQVDTAEIDISAIFVSSYEVLDAVVEAISAGIRQIVIFTP